MLSGMTAAPPHPARTPVRPAPATPGAAGAAAPRRSGKTVRPRARAVAPGLALALGVAAVATVAGQHLPLVGSAVPGAVIGAAIAIVIKPGARLAPGLKWASTFILQCSVVLLGAQLSVAEAAHDRGGARGI